MGRLPRRLVKRLAMTLALWGLMSGMEVAAQPETESSRLLRASGRIASVDMWKGTVQVEERTFGLFPTGAVKEFVVSARTDISDPSGQQSFKFRELVPGASVKIEYAVEHGKNLARSIVIRQSAPRETASSTQAPRHSAARAPASEPSSALSPTTAP